MGRGVGWKMLIFEIAIILLACKLAGSISVRLGQPSVLGKLLVGIILGPAVLGILSTTPSLDELSQIGVILLMFIAGLETDLDEFKRAGKASFFVGISGILFPLAGGYAAGLMMGLTDFQAMFLGLLLSATSVSISVQALKELNKLKSREGMAILGAAVIDDVVVIIALAFLMSISSGTDVHLGMMILKKLIFFACAILVGWSVVPRVLRWFAALKVSQTIISAALITCFIYSYAAEVAGVAAIIGAYFAGIAISLTSFKQEIVIKVETLGYSLFIPIFFTSIGLKVTFAGMTDYIWTIVWLSILAIITKLIGAALGAKASQFSWRNSFGIGAAMVSRGEVALIIAAIGLDSKLVSQELFAALIVVVLVTTIVTPPLMKTVFKDGKRNIEFSTATDFNNIKA
jgi:monovalent cation:proton antiporter-2 (CPA2) family protein